MDQLDLPPHDSWYIDGRTEQMSEIQEGNSPPPSLSTPVLKEMMLDIPICLKCVRCFWSEYLKKCPCLLKASSCQAKSRSWVKFPIWTTRMWSLCQHAGSNAMIAPNICWKCFVAMLHLLYSTCWHDGRGTFEKHGRRAHQGLPPRKRTCLTHSRLNSMQRKPPLAEQKGKWRKRPS
jgi:hypothetical protein